MLCYHLLISHPLSLIQASAKLFPVPPFQASFPFFSEMLTDQLFWALRLAQGSEKDTPKEMKRW